MNVDDAPEKSRNEILGEELGGSCKESIQRDLEKTTEEEKRYADWGIEAIEQKTISRA